MKYILHEMYLIIVYFKFLNISKYKIIVTIFYYPKCDRNTDRNTNYNEFIP